MGKAIANPILLHSSPHYLEKSNNMSKKYWQSKPVKIIGLLFILWLSVRACATTEYAWKEQVLLHDGSKIIVQREEIYDAGLRHEIGQGAPLAEQTIRFKIPNTNQSVTWKSSNRSFEQPENLNVLSLDFLNDIPYLATTTAYCLAYNRWGRPNPPYIFFKYIGEWQRIPVEEFPEQFKINLIFGTAQWINEKIAKDSKQYGFLRAETVAEINKESGRSKQFYYIFRTPFPIDNMTIVGGCPEMIYYKCGWISPHGPFRDLMDKTCK